MRLMSKWTDGERKAPEPLEGPITGTVVAGTIIWFLLFVGQLPFYGWFSDHGHTWWIWTCAAGAGLGLLGIWYVRHREAALRREAAPPASRTSHGDGSGGDGSGSDGSGSGTSGGGTGTSGPRPTPRTGDTAEAAATRPSRGGTTPDDTRR